MQNFELLTSEGIIRTYFNNDLISLKNWWTHLLKSDLDNKIYKTISVEHFTKWATHRKGTTRDKPSSLKFMCILSRRRGDKVSRAHSLQIHNSNLEMDLSPFHLHNTVRWRIPLFFFFLNNYHEMSELSLMLTILGKHTIWELRNISRNSSHLHDIVTSLKANYKYKVQSHFHQLICNQSSPSPPGALPAQVHGW